MSQESGVRSEAAAHGTKGGRSAGENESEVACRWLGRIDYGEALALQEKIVGEKIASPEAPDELLLLEHDAV